VVTVNGAMDTQGRPPSIGYEMVGAEAPAAPAALSPNGADIALRDLSVDTRS